MTLQTERELFEACVDLAAGQRTAWLEEHCGDSALRDRVLRLLRAHDSAQERGSLERSPIVTARRIGDFDLLERIGEGAMGEVWLAEQTAPVRRRVAVKIVKAGTGSREVIARFELERQALAMMSHPHIAHIVEAGTTDDGRPYFAMEYVPGIPLTKYCDQHRLGIDERLALFVLVCEAVQHAHQKGVIHRDLKPGNLLVTEIDGRPSPEGDRLRHRQGRGAQPAAEPRAHDDRSPDRHAGIHEPGAGATLAARCRHARGCLFARRRAARAADRRVAVQDFGSECDAGHCSCRSC